MLYTMIEVQYQYETMIIDMCHMFILKIFSSSIEKPHRLTELPAIKFSIKYLKVNCETLLLLLITIVSFEEM